MKRLIPMVDPFFRPTSLVSPFHFIFFKLWGDGKDYSIVHQSEVISAIVEKADCCIKMSLSNGQLEH